MTLSLHPSANNSEPGLSRTSTTEHLDGEKDLIANAQAGDVGAYEQLYRNHVGTIYPLCLRMTGQRDTAEEMTQETFIAAWEKLPGFSGRSAFGTWLHRIAFNTVLMRQRSNHRYRNRVVLHSDVDEPGVKDNGSAVPAHHTRMDLEDALGRLPANARTVFILHEIEGYRHDEIAEMTGVTTGTSKSQLHRARKLLQEYLDE